jgi:glucose-6-phosphate 1-epimerase
LKSEELIADLNDRFGIAGKASVVAGREGLPKVLITSADAAGEMYLHGAHVTSWAPKGSADVLYCSPNTQWQDGKAIRGGVPVCFPWFGDKGDDPKAPAHGFVRTKAWELATIEQVEGGVVVAMQTASDDSTRKWWPHGFRLLCRATFGAELKAELIVSNIGATPFSVEEALHAYFHVGNAERIAVRGLDGTPYIDKVDHFTEKTQVGDVRLTAETDRVYLATSQDVEIVDPIMQRCISIHKHDSQNTVVWNPWLEKSSGMSDLGAGEWKNFVCVEVANIGTTAVEVAPADSRTMAVQVRVT